MLVKFVQRKGDWWWNSEVGWRWWWEKSYDGLEVLEVVVEWRWRNAFVPEEDL